MPPQLAAPAQRAGQVGAGAWPLDLNKPTGVLDSLDENLGSYIQRFGARLCEISQRFEAHAHLDHPARAGLQQWRQSWTAVDANKLHGAQRKRVRKHEAFPVNCQVSRQPRPRSTPGLPSYPGET